MGEIANTERHIALRANRNQNQAGADGAEVVPDGAQQGVENLIPNHLSPARVVDRAEMSDDVAFGRGDLNRLYGAKHLSNQASHPLGGFARGLPGAANTGLKPAHHQGDQDERQEDEQGQLCIDAEQDDQRPNPK